MDGILYACLAGERVSARLWLAMLAEFKRNGGQMMTHGKVRHLRRAVRRGCYADLIVTAEDVAAAARLTASRGRPSKPLEVFFLGPL